MYYAIFSISIFSYPWLKKLCGSNAEYIMGCVRFAGALF